MTRLPEDKLFYHGSYTEVATIDLRKCNKGLDFGQGFYVSSSQQQAVAFVPASVRKAIRQAKISKSFRVEDGRISVYQFSNGQDLSIHYFERADKDWLHFVAGNRDHTLFPEIIRQLSDCDIIAGKVADDATAVTLNAYISGTYGEPGSPRADEIAIGFLEPERLKDQFCFRTEKAIQCLRFLRSYRYGDIR